MKAYARRICTIISLAVRACDFDDDSDPVTLDSHVEMGS